MELRLKPSTLDLQSYGGGRLNLVRQLTVTLSTPGHTVEAVIQVQSGAPVDLLLGTDLQVKLGFTLLQTLPGGRAIDLVKQSRWQLCPRDEPTEESVDGCLEVGPTSKNKQKASTAFWISTTIGLHWIVQTYRLHQPRHPCHIYTHKDHSSHWDWKSEGGEVTGSDGSTTQKHHTVTAGLYTQASQLTLWDWKSEGGEGTGSDGSTTQKHHTVTAGLYTQASQLTLWDWKSEGGEVTPTAKELAVTAALHRSITQ